MKLDGFATLSLAKLQLLKGRYRGLAHEDEMAELLSHCLFGLNPRPPPKCPRRTRGDFCTEAVVFTGTEVGDFMELALVFATVAATLGLMVVFGAWWYR